MKPAVVRHLSERWIPCAHLAGVGVNVALRGPVIESRAIGVRSIVGGHVGAVLAVIAVYGACEGDGGKGY